MLHSMWGGHGSISGARTCTRSHPTTGHYASQFLPDSMLDAVMSRFSGEKSRWGEALPYARSDCDINHRPLGHQKWAVERPVREGMNKFRNPRSCQVEVWYNLVR